VVDEFALAVDATGGPGAEILGGGLAAGFDDQHPVAGFAGIDLESQVVSGVPLLLDFVAERCVDHLDVPSRPIQVLAVVGGGGRRGGGIELVEFVLPNQAISLRLGNHY